MGLRLQARVVGTLGAEDSVQVASGFFQVAPRQGDAGHLQVSFRYPGRGRACEIIQERLQQASGLLIAAEGAQGAGQVQSNPEVLAPDRIGLRGGAGLFQSSLPQRMSSGQQDDGPAVGAAPERDDPEAVEYGSLLEVGDPGRSKRQPVGGRGPVVVAGFPASEGQVAQRPNPGVRSEVRFPGYPIRPFERGDGVPKRPALERSNPLVHVAGHFGVADGLLVVHRTHAAGPPASARP